MYSLVSGMYQAYLAPTQLNILVVGGAGVGKTTMLERIKVTKFASKISNQPQHKQSGSIKDGVPNVPTQWLKPTSGTDEGETKRRGSKNNGKSVENGDTHKMAPLMPFPPGDMDDGAKSKARSSWLCPAPSRYAEASKDDDDDEDDSVAPLSPVDLMGGIPSPNPQRNVRKTTSSSMESVDLVMDNASRAACKVATCCVSSGARDDCDASVDCGDTVETLEEFARGSMSVASSAMPSMTEIEAELAEAEAELTAAEMKEYDLKPNTKMLPLRKIRRTVGMNLGKVHISGTHCHFWDLGGRMHELWERYYCDSDAVIFVWKAPSPDEQADDDDGGGDGDDDDSTKPKQIDSALQQSLLEEVRNAIPDDVPFLVLGHMFFDPQKKRCKSKSPMTDVLYSTDRLLPHYHNPYQALFFANAASGQGVKSAMEWLIPIAKRQLKVREARPVEEVDDKH